MTDVRVAKRYARALITLAEEMGKLEIVDGDLQRISKLVASSRELQLFLQNPTIGKDKKRKAATEIFSKMVDELTFKFILLLISKGRERVLRTIIEQYQHMHDEKMGIVRAQVRSAVEFDAGQAKKLIHQLEGFTGKKVEVTYSLDTRLQGGFVAQMGDTVIDASIRRQLELLKQKFMSDGSITN